MSIQPSRVLIFPYLALGPVSEVSHRHREPSESDEFQLLDHDFVGSLRQTHPILPPVGLPRNLRVDLRTELGALLLPGRLRGRRGHCHPDTRTMQVTVWKL